MGQPHKVCLVARVHPSPGKPEESRCVTVVAFYHNWCYAKLPLYCANRFRHLARTEANVALIQRDLDQYHEGLKRSNDTPCPYIAFLARAAFTTNLDQGGDQPRPYFSRIHITCLPRNCLSVVRGGGCQDTSTCQFKSLTEGDGSTVVDSTVIDISTPDALKYCFVAFKSRGNPEGNKVPRCVPLSAAEYLRSDDPVILDPLDCDEDQVAGAVSMKAIMDLDDLPLLTLDVLTMTWRSWLEEHRPGSHCYAGTSESSDSEGSGINISPSHLDADEGERSSLSGHSDGSGRARLEWINIDGCNIFTKDITDLLTSQPSLFRGVEAIIHPAFLSLGNVDPGVSKPATIPTAFRLYYGDEKGMGGASGWISLPLFGAEQLVQNLADLIELHTTHMLFNLPMPPNLCGMFASSYRHNGRPWAVREVQAILTQVDCKSIVESYSLFFIARSNRWTFPEDPLKGYDYDFVLPGGERKFVEIKTFLEHLEKNGWPMPKDRVAVNWLVEKFSNSVGLLQDFDGPMKDRWLLGMRKEWKYNWEDEEEDGKSEEEKDDRAEEEEGSMECGEKDEDETKTRSV